MRRLLAAFWVFGLIRETPDEYELELAERVIRTSGCHTGGTASPN